MPLAPGRIRLLGKNLATHVARKGVIATKEDEQSAATTTNTDEPKKE